MLDELRRDYIRTARAKGLSEAAVIMKHAFRNAAKNCPVWLGNGRRKHLGFPDPAAATGSEQERLASFRRVRDGLKQQVFAYLERFEDTEPEEVKFYAP